MIKTLKKISVCIVFISFVTGITAQNAYHNYQEIKNRVYELSSKYPDKCSVRVLAGTAGGKDILLMSVGTGDRDSKPGVAVVGGVDGVHILGRELALGFASSLLDESASSEVRSLLEKVTFYIFPDVNPDASGQYFSDIRYERRGNATATDDDRDFANGEDGYEDLNNDGYITLIRVRDAAGRYVTSPDDERVMVESDISEGSTGKYLVFSEGIDNDSDGLFNEDGPGGVDFNRNFTYDYEFFGKQAGMYPVSEPETKAVAEFLFGRFNIYCVFTFGPRDNLGQPFIAAEKTGDDQIPRSVMKDDQQVNKLVSDKYHEITGIKGSPVSGPAPGNFMEWAYYHYGRYSFGTPAWWLTDEKIKNQELLLLKYCDSHRISNVFVPWTPVEHPDFPGKTTEVGGIRPFAIYNPPADSIDKLVKTNYLFIKTIAAMHPELEFLDIKTEKVSQDIFRITLRVHNKGIFATCAAIGESNMWTRVMRLSLELRKGQTIISGKKVQKIDRLAGGQSAEFSWLISGAGSVLISAGAANTGTITSDIELR